MKNKHMSPMKPTLLLILDGWGQAPASAGNAVSLASTPNLDRILSTYPKTLLDCSGRAVGLPPGFMGNSEVGHMNIGAGRVVYQEMTIIDMAIEEKRFAENPALTGLFKKAKSAHGRLHLLGLLSDGGVHSHINHLFALLRTAKDHGVREAYVHVFLDGRDTSPTSGINYVRALQKEMDCLEFGRIATITGRYYAMDRDKRWDRNLLAYDAMTQGLGEIAADPVAAVQAAYDAGETDEFVRPRVICGRDGAPVACIEDNDAVFMFNFRADRIRQITRSLFDPDFTEFERKVHPRLSGVATMTLYEGDFGLPVAFPPEHEENILGQVVSDRGIRQLRIAETEKYAHVTYFFNCGREEPFPGEDRILIPSPREVATYDLKPEMSAVEVTDTLCREWDRGVYDFAVCNLANLDMVGHTGIIPAAIKACETVDLCVGRIAEKVLGSNGCVLLTADHGNAEEMLDPKGKVQTSHSLNPVAFVLMENKVREMRLRKGVLGDIAPTVLDLWGEPKPAAMTGKSLIQR